jgi:hypothetical protein
MDDDYEPRRGSGSRIGVLLVGLILGILVMTAVWVAIAGNPLSDANEVTYLPITVASINETKDSICWSENPRRRDSVQSCAILALDPKARVPEVGDDVTVGVVGVAPPDGNETRHVVYVSTPRDPAPATPTSPASD